MWIIFFCTKTTHSFWLLLLRKYPCIWSWFVISMYCKKIVTQRYLCPRNLLSKREKCTKRTPSWDCTIRMTVKQVFITGESNAMVSKQGASHGNLSLWDIGPHWEDHSYAHMMQYHLVLGTQRGWHCSECSLKPGIPGKANDLERSTKGSNSLWAMPLGVMLTGLGSEDDWGRPKGPQVFEFRRKLLSCGSLKQIWFFFFTQMYPKSWK